MAGSGWQAPVTTAHWMRNFKYAGRDGPGPGKCLLCFEGIWGRGSFRGSFRLVRCCLAHRTDVEVNRKLEFLQGRRDSDSEEE